MRIQTLLCIEITFSGKKTINHEKLPIFAMKTIEEVCMIEYLKGTLTELTPTLAVVECYGVGYGVNISLNTYAAIRASRK